VLSLARIPCCAVYQTKSSYIRCVLRLIIDRLFIALFIAFIAQVVRTTSPIYLMVDIRQLIGSLHQSSIREIKHYSGLESKKILNARSTLSSSFYQMCPWAYYQLIVYSLRSYILFSEQHHHQ